MGVSELDRVPETSSSSSSTTGTPIGIVTDGEYIKETNPITFTSTDERPISYPEGGTTAWLVVLGSWLALFSSMGLMNSIGAFHAHIQRDQLSGDSPSSVSWIFGRFPPKPLSMARALPDPMILRNPALCLTAMGAFFMEWGLFVPLSYLILYALGHGAIVVLLVHAPCAHQCGCCAGPGRWVPGYLSDRLGRFNMLIATILGCDMSLACLWLTSGSSPALLIAFAVVFGFFSGDNVSLAPVCIGQLCTIESYGRYYSTANVLYTLTGIPIAGEIFDRSQGSFRNLIIFTIVSYAASFICLVIAKLLCCGRRGLWAIF
ncbi:Putative MFS transporter superfamily [Colletotrichum destructivum]|uniref:MFS transporter superfamily n=1 Tax=Colletotrichum destructivum TaxID=34406 RepID=A0AAX4IME3_9PEZI|nr:Putative MFS transporter superfamily [Colletotrichum destructivum]